MRPYSHGYGADVTCLTGPCRAYAIWMISMAAFSAVFMPRRGNTIEFWRQIEADHDLGAVLIPGRHQHREPDQFARQTVRAYTRRPRWP